MSQLATGILGAIAVSLTCGAVQFALGRDLSGIMRQPSRDSATAATAVNRVAKADRAAVVAGAAQSTRTISLRVGGLSETSVLVRIPLAREGRNNPPANPPSRFLTKSSDRKLTVACEPVVSILTEIAKQLQPGRCVT
jgi:hypothetical protein